ncbi:MAG: hypothetical protein ACRDAG_13535 [Cetobacterium somerae]|uniref:hypothetical protein n=1 Tax=Cetobacterium somerae TaxID=188913 RepID=UPI003F3D2365
MKSNENFIDQEYIEKVLQKSEKTDYDEIERVLNKAQNKNGLTHMEVATLLQIKDKNQKKRLYEIAGEIKRSIYGNRIVVFAPYMSVITVLITVHIVVTKEITSFQEKN